MVQPSCELPEPWTSLGAQLAAALGPGQEALLPTVLSLTLFQPEVAAFTGVPAGVIP